MKKKLLTSFLALSMFIGSMSVASAEAIPFPWWELIKIAWDIAQDSGSGTQCATQITDSSNQVLKCMASGGCQWDSGSAVNWGGHC